MARFKIKKIAESKGAKNAMELARMATINYNLARELWKENDVNIETKTLEQIAQKLGVDFLDLFESRDSSS